MSRFSFVVLGNGGMVNHRLPHNGLVIFKHLLVDCPPDVVNSFQTVQLSTLDVKYVFISHFHADHTFGFPFFLLNRWIVGGFGGLPFTVLGPAGTRAYLTTLVELGLQPGHPALEWFYTNVEIQEIGPFEQVMVGDFQMEFFRLKHIDSSLGFALTETTGNVVFSCLTDTVWGSEVERELGKFPAFAWIDMNGGASGLHASYEDTLGKGIAITGERTIDLGTHVAEALLSRDSRIRMVAQGDSFATE